jgi:hypothetical protein
MPQLHMDCSSLRGPQRLKSYPLPHTLQVAAVSAKSTKEPLGGVRVVLMAESRIQQRFAAFGQLGPND